MRALFTTQPGHGHLNPMLPYASALRGAGHEVCFATAPSFCAMVRRLGFQAVPAGHDFTWEHAVDFFPEMATAAAEGPRQVNELSQRIVWERWTPRMTGDLLELIAEWRPDLIVREAAEYGGSLAGRATGAPVACALWGAPFHDSVWDRHLAVNHTFSGYRAQCERWGVDSDVRAALAEELMLCTLPPSWMAAGDRGLGRVEHFRSEPQDRAEGESLDPSLTGGRSGGLIYATLGTVHNKQHRLRKAMLAALADVPASVIFTTGPGIDLDRVGDPGENIALEPFVPQSLIIPRSDLVVSHAGLGTIIGALYAGVPMVLISIAVDHPINAERAGALGVARVLDAHDCQPERLRETILEALADRNLRDRATEVRDECLALPEIVEAVGVLEAYASKRTGP